MDLSLPKRKNRIHRMQLEHFLRLEHFFRRLNWEIRQRLGYRGFVPGRKQLGSDKVLIWSC